MNWFCWAPNSKAMKVNIFKIRLEEDLLPADQNKLDRFLGTHDILKNESAFVGGTEPFWSVIVYYQEHAPGVTEASFGNYSGSDAPLSEGEAKILDALRRWRTEKAGERNIPAYCIATNKELLALAKFRPARMQDFNEIKGFGRHKIENYGGEILDLLESV